MLARQHSITGILKRIPPKQQHSQFIEFARLFLMESYRRPYRHGMQKHTLKHSPQSVIPEKSPYSQLPPPEGAWLGCAIVKKSGF